MIVTQSFSVSVGVFSYFSFFWKIYYNLYFQFIIVVVVLRFLLFFSKVIIVLFDGFGRGDLLVLLFLW